MDLNFVVKVGAIIGGGTLTVSGILYHFWNRLPFPNFASTKKYDVPPRTISVTRTPPPPDGTIH